MATIEPMDRLRAVCLSLPEAYEEETWNSATFRVRGKIFCMGGHDPLRPSVSMKSTKEEQQALLSQGEPYFSPAYVGYKGWIGVDLTGPGVDWNEIVELVVESYRFVAPNRLSSRLLLDVEDTHH